MRIRSFCAMLLWCVAGVLACGPGFADGSVFIPGFLDPAHRFDKPDLAGLRTIRFLTTDDDPPFGFAAPDGALTGYDVDLARAICGVLAVSCSIQARGFEALLPALRSNAGDAVVASLAITARSRAEVDFSLPVLRTPARFAARRGQATDALIPESLGHAAVGVQAGTAHAAYLAAFFPEAAVKTYPDPESLRTALKSGQVAYLFADGLATALWLGGTGAGDCCRFAGGPFTESRYFGEGSAIAVRKGDRTLKAALDFALATLSRNGTMADLYLKYFPIGFY